MRAGAAGSRGALGAAAALALLAGCATPGLLPYRADEPLTVTVPLALAAVRDERVAFAGLFERELRAAGAPGGIEAWLHGVTVLPPGRSDQSLDEIERRFAARRAGTVVLFLPGLFGDCVDDQSVPFGDGLVRPPAQQAAMAYAAYADLGLHAMRLVRLAGRASAEHNGERLAEAIRAEAARPGVERIVLVGYSKGVPDAQHALRALQQAGDGAGRVAALVSVAGAVMGTPLADHFRPLYDAISPRVDPFGCTPSDGDELRSITRHERVRWLAANPPVPGPAYYSIVAYADAGELAPPLRSTHALLARVDPRNDGQLLAGDAILPGSVLLAAARSDHWDVALPRDRHPSAVVRGLTSGRGYPREALLRATLKWVIGQLP
jgi:hypothetical protein